MMKRSVVHSARGIVATSTPILASTYLRVAVTSCLLDAEGDRDERVIVRWRQGFSGVTLRGSEKDFGQQASR